MCFMAVATDDEECNELFALIFFRDNVEAFNKQKPIQSKNRFLAAAREIWIMKTRLIFIQQTIFCSFAHPIGDYVFSCLKRRKNDIKSMTEKPCKVKVNFDFISSRECRSFLSSRKILVFRKSDWPWTWNFPFKKFSTWRRNKRKSNKV